MHARPLPPDGTYSLIPSRCVCQRWSFPMQYAGHHPVCRTRLDALGVPAIGLTPAEAFERLGTPGAR